jgi:carboxylesterase type B
MIFAAIGFTWARAGLGVVDTAYGRVSGVFENGATYYKGVPHAKPPIGDLRWAAAQTGTIPAVKVTANAARRAIESVPAANE